MRPDLSGWVLVVARLDRRDRYHTPCLLVSRRSSPGGTDTISLAVNRKGIIRELIELPNDLTALAWQVWSEAETVPVLRVRPLNPLSRMACMAWRIYLAYRHVPLLPRRRAGLHGAIMLTDLSKAYRLATRLLHPADWEWAEWGDVLEDTDRRLIRRHISQFPSAPRFHIVILGEDGEGGATQLTVESVRHQLYRHVACAIVGAGGEGQGPAGGCVSPPGLDVLMISPSEMEEWLRRFNAQCAQEDWVVLLRPGDRLAEHALYWFAVEGLAHPEAALLYSDDDVLDAQGRRIRPRCKPDWSIAYLRAMDYIGSAVAVRGDALAQAGGLQAEDCIHGVYDVVLRAMEKGEGKGSAVVHIPAVLVHRRDEDGNGRGGKGLRAAPQQRMAAVRRHLQHCGISADVMEIQAGCRRIRYHMPEAPPLVTIIVPTRDAEVLLRRCVESVMTGTRYGPFEVLVVDNGSQDPAACAYLNSLSALGPIRVLRDERAFNYSALNNMAEGHARGEVLCLLNNDTEVISPDWLHEMVGHLLQEKVGVVGAKLLYSDGRVQHAGDVVGVGGTANHLHACLERDEFGYENRAIVAQDLSAVTAACLVTWRSLYRELGGLDEVHLPVTFNDVDYCLRVKEAGYHVIWTPHAELYHHESASRRGAPSKKRRSEAKAERAYLRRRWRHVVVNDPFYNPNFSRARPDFSFSLVSHVKKPWLSQ